MPSLQLAKRFPLASYDVDFESKATLQALMRFMDDIAWEHARELGLGFGELAHQDLAWVIARLKIEIDEYPRWGDTIRELARAATASVLINQISRRPHRADNMFNRILDPQERAFDENLKKLPSADNGKMRCTVEVRYSDLDLNGHVNNVKYMEWLLDSYPLAFHRENRLVAVEVNFISEALYGDTVVVHSRTGGRFHLHGILRASDNRELFRARVAWLKNRLNPGT